MAGQAAPGLPAVGRQRGGNRAGRVAALPAKRGRAGLRQKLGRGRPGYRRARYQAGSIDGDWCVGCRTSGWPRCCATRGGPTGPPGRASAVGRPGWSPGCISGSGPSSAFFHVRIQCLLLEGRPYPRRRYLSRFLGRNPGNGAAGWLESPDPDVESRACLARRPPGLSPAIRPGGRTEPFPPLGLPWHCSRASCFCCFRPPGFPLDSQLSRDRGHFGTVPNLVIWGLCRVRPPRGPRPRRRLHNGVLCVFSAGVP